MVGSYCDSSYTHGSHAHWIAGSWNLTDERFCSIITVREVATVFPWVSFVVRGDCLICPTCSIVLLGPYHLFLGGSKITADGDCSHEIKRCLLLFWKKSYGQPRQHIKNQRHCFTNKGPSSQSYGFSSSHVLMWEWDYNESWAPKNCCFWTVVLQKTLASPLDCKEIQPVHPKGDQSWVFIGRTDAGAEAPIIWPPHAKSWLIGKDPDAGRDWEQEEKGTTEDEMAGWHHRLNGHEFE